MRVLEGWLWQFNLQLHRCELVLVADITDPDSALVMADVTAACIINSEADRESFDMQLRSLHLAPALLDEAADWFWSQGLPCLLPTGLHENARGVRTSQRALLEPISAAASNSFERGRVSDILLASSSSPKRPMAGQQQAGEGGAEALARGGKEDLPRFLHLVIKEVRLTNLPAEHRGLLDQAGVMVTCNGQQICEQAFGREPAWVSGLLPEEGPSPEDTALLLPMAVDKEAWSSAGGVLRVGKEFHFLYTGVRPRITVEVGESSYVPAGDWSPQLTAAFQLDDVEEASSGVAR